MNYSITSTPTIFVDQEGLQNLYARCSRTDTRVALIGFNEYSKHLVNLCGENIVGIYDPEDWKIGISFRGKRVLPRTSVVNINLIAVCDIKLMYDFSGEISLLYGEKIEVFCPPRLHYKTTIEIKPSEQEAIYKAVLQEREGAPVSMMSEEKLFLLMELLRYALRFPGDIIEMGVYQGGSAWYLAKILTYLGEQRHMFLMDVFETHMMHQNATMCNDEIARRLRFYPHITLLEGLVDDERLLNTIGSRPICFAHYDLGPHPKALEFLWNNLVPGAPLVLDNYGHLAADPVQLDRFFGDRGTRVIRLPWSEQGIVFKHNG